MLRDDTVEPERLEPLQPPARIGDITGRGRVPESLEPLDARTPFGERQPPHLLPVPEQHVEDDELGRDLRRQPPNP